MARGQTSQQISIKNLNPTDWVATKVQQIRDEKVSRKKPERLQWLRDNGASKSWSDEDLVEACNVNKVGWRQKGVGSGATGNPSTAYDRWVKEQLIAAGLYTRRTQTEDNLDEKECWEMYQEALKELATKKVPDAWKDNPFEWQSKIRAEFKRAEENLKNLE